MTDHQHTANVLHRAADLIEERGWTQATAGDPGADPWGGGSGSAAPVCIEGGILAALGVDTEGDLPPLDFIHCTAYKAVQTYLGLPDSELVFHWNDETGRTASEVIETLRAAAAIEQARHDAEQPATVAVGV